MTTPEAGLAAACEAFATALTETPAFREWADARAVREADAEVDALSKDLARLNIEVRESWKQGGTASPTLEAQHLDAQERLEHHPVAQRERAAVAALIDVLRQSNQLVSDSLGVEYATNAAPPRAGGCCG